VLLAAASGAGDGLSIQVNGLPVLHRGLARSVRHNQVASLALAVLLVVALLAFFFRSIATGVLAALPTFFTLLVIHGLMGVWRINLDIGTSLLGSLILANGVDYAVHLISAWHVPPGTSMARAAELSAQRAGPAIGINAAAMFTGFFVLAMGEAKPLQNVSSLKAAAMLVGALASLIIVPIFARKNVYPILNEEPEAEPGAAAQPVPAEPPNQR
jgi:predicted RND superfamily exporter protein